jgi:hypothetical protein
MPSSGMDTTATIQAIADDGFRFTDKETATANASRT